MAKKGFFASLFGGGGKRSGGSRASKGRATSSRSKARSSASKRTSSKVKTTSQAKRSTSKPTAQAKRQTRARRKSDVGKIYWTNDGYFTQHENPKRTKQRRVAVIDQRDLDGALAVTKIYSKYDENGKERKGKAYIEDLTLSPKEHSSLKQDSVVGNQVHIGTRKAGAKTPAEKNFQPIMKRDLVPTSDKLTKKELKTVQEKLQNDTPKHRATHERTMQKWRNGFKEEK